MLRIFILICMIFLSVSSVHARGHSGHGNNFLRGSHFEREISNFNRIREREFRRVEDREFGRFWGNEHREVIIFFGAIPESINSARRAARQYYHLGLDDLRLENYAQAIEEFTQAIEIYPQLSVAYRFRGVAYYKQKEFDKAIADIYKADQLGSTDSSSFINLIKQVASHQDAMTSFRQGIDDMRHDNNTQAIAEFTKAIEIYPDLKTAYYCRGIAYYKENESSKALADINKAATLGHPVDPNLINSIKDSGNLPQSIEELTQAIQINPNDATLYYRRAVCYKKNQNYAQAIPDDTKAIQLDPEFGNAYRNRGASYFLEKEYEKSWADMTKAQELGTHINPVLIEKIKQALGK